MTPTLIRRMIDVLARFVGMDTLSVADVVPYEDVVAGDVVVYIDRFNDLAFGLGRVDGFAIVTGIGRDDGRIILDGFRSIDRTFSAEIIVLRRSVVAGLAA